MTTDAVQTIGLSKDYDIGFVRKRFRALDDVNLTVREGEIFGLIGPNGAGKTTTLKLLMGLVFPTAGEARILGRPVGDPEMKREIGYLPEQPYFYEYLTGRELLSYFGQLFGLARKDRIHRIEELLERVGLAEAGDMALRKYSKGMTQRLGIAQALINRPRLVFFDEPMSGLDPVGRREMALLIRALRDEGTTVFFCSHVLPDVERLCDRVAILNRGRLVKVGSLTDILDVSVHTVEVVAENVRPELEPRLREMAREMRPVGERWLIAFEAEHQFQKALPFFANGAARLVSVNPVKPTLEDHFLRELGGPRGES